MNIKAVGPFAGYDAAPSIAIRLLMNVLTRPLKDHHKHCDNLFADAEAAVAAQDWSDARSLTSRFSGELEAHFRTEEETLFPAFESATGMSGGPTQMMRYEHAQMRDLIDQMHSALGRQEEDSFSGAAETLLILMQQHNMKEENILYPMCDQHLAGQCAALGPMLEKGLVSSCPMVG